MRGAPSSTMFDTPRRVSSRAHVSPATPAPTITTSGCMTVIDYTTRLCYFFRHDDARGRMAGPTLRRPRLVPVRLGQLRVHDQRRRHHPPHLFRDGCDPHHAGEPGDRPVGIRERG